MALSLQIKNINKANTLLLKAIIYIGAFLTIISLFGPNPFLVAPSLIALYFIVRNIYISKYFAGFLFALLYQWVQVSIKVIYGCITFKDISELTIYPENIIKAYLLSSIGLILLSFAISIFLKKIKFNEDKINQYIKNLSIIKLIVCFYLTTFVAFLLPNAFFQVSSQISAFKWGLFYLLFLAVYIQKKNKWILIIIIGSEFILGFLSYFAAWKTILLFTIISYLSVVKINHKVILLGIGSAFILCFIGLFWTGIKKDYRKFISQGNKQVVLVSQSEAFNKLGELTSNFEVDDNITKDFIDRISYIDYFSACLNYVPSHVPHENGNLTKSAIKHTLIPRFLDSNKAIIDESTHLSKYTGRFFSNLSMGVSFSLGYFGDLYVDYGEFGMLIALFFYGLLIGFIFKNLFINLNKKSPYLAIAILQMSFIILYKFEISLIKLTGNLILFWIVYRLLTAQGFPQFSNWLLKISRN